MAVLTESYLLDSLSLLTALVLLGYTYFKWKYQYWKRRNIPYIEPTIPFGNSQNPLRRTAHVMQVIADTYEVAKSKGWRHCGIYMFTTPAYVVVDLDLVKQVLTKDFQYFMDRGMYTNEKIDPIGCTLFVLNGKRWKNLRAKLTPTFTSGKLKAMFHTLTDCGLLLEKYIEENTDSATAVDIKDILGRFSADTIGSCAFGLECNSFQGPKSLFREYGDKAIVVTKLKAIEMLFRLNFPNIARAIGLRQVEKDVSDFYTKVVTDTVSYREKNNFARKDFLQLLIAMKNNRDKQEHGSDGDGTDLTMNEIVAQSFAFFIGGFETSATTMSFALFELANHLGMQDKVRKEINTILAKHNNQFTYDALVEMKYLRQIIDETLRLHSPARILQRKCAMDYKVPGEDVVIEKGTMVFVSIDGIQHDEEIYENPRVFDPERFNEENKKKRHPYAYIPFGEGPRICIGERFAILQTAIGLASILRNFRVTLNKKTKLPLKMSPSGLINIPEGGIWVNIEKI